MRNLKIPQAALLGVALTALFAATSAMAHDAPPLSGDDARVGAPPVIVAKPKPATVVNAVPVVAPQAINPSLAKPAAVVTPKAVTPVVVAPKPVPATATVAPELPVPASQALVAAPAPQQAITQKPARGSQDGGPARPDTDRSGLAFAPVDHGLGSSSAYHRPEYGYQLPQEWAAPDHYIGDYDRYGLSRPANGFGWSRYYDDAVLTDQWGRVYDWRDDVNWADQGERYSDGRDHDRKSRGRKYNYKGRWTGSWDGGPEQSYQGVWRGTVRPHWSGNRAGENYGASSGYRTSNFGGDYGTSYSYGYDAGGTTVTTVVVQAAAPVMSTRTISYETVSYAPVRKKAVRRWKPKPRCVC